MIQKPTYLASENAEPFQNKSVVQAYRHRPGGVLIKCMNTPRLNGRL